MSEAVHPLSYSIIDCTSEDPKHPVNSLISIGDLTKHLSKGWRCVKKPNYPLEFVIKLQSTSQIRELNILSHPFKIAEKVQILVRDSESPNEQLNKFHLLGHVTFNYNEDNQCELKQIKLTVIGNEIKLKFMSCYQHPKNKYNQIGIIGIEIIGRQNPSLQYGIKDYTITDLKSLLEKSNTKSSTKSNTNCDDNLMINPPKEVDTITGSIVVNIESIILQIQLEKQQQQPSDITTNSYSLIKSNVKLANKLIDIGHEIYKLSKQEITIEIDKQIRHLKNKRIKLLKKSNLQLKDYELVLRDREKGIDEDIQSDNEEYTIRRITPFHEFIDKNKQLEVQPKAKLGMQTDEKSFSVEEKSLNQLLLSYFKQNNIELPKILLDSTSMPYYSTFGPYISSCTIDTNPEIKLASLIVIEKNIIFLFQKANNPLEFYKSLCSLFIHFCADNDLKIYKYTLDFLTKILKIDGNPFNYKNLNEADIIKGIRIMLKVLFLKCVDTNQSACKMTIDFILNLKTFKYMGIEKIIEIGNEIIQHAPNTIHYKALLGRLIIYDLLLNDMSSMNDIMLMLDLIYFCIGYRDMEVRQKSIQILIKTYTKIGDKALSKVNNLSKPSQDIIKTKIEQICAKTPDAQKGKIFGSKINDKNMNNSGIIVSSQSNKGNIVNKKTIESTPQQPPPQKPKEQSVDKPPAKPPIDPSKDKSELKLEADQLNPHSKTTNISKIGHRMSDPNIPESKTCHLL